MPSCLPLTDRVIGRGRNLRETCMPIRLPTPKSRRWLKRPPRLTLGISLIARLSLRWSRALCAPVPACRRISDVLCSVRGMPSWVHAVRYGIFPAIRTSDFVPEVIGGVREAECGRLMTDFFARRR